MHILCTYVDFSYIPVTFSVGDIVVVELVGSVVAVGGILVCSNIQLLH